MDKGDYVVKLQIRHESVPLLERLSDVPIHVQHKLQSSVSLTLYDSYRNAITDGKKFTAQTLRPHTLCPIYVTSLAELPKGLAISSGSFLSGHITYTKDDNRKKSENFVFKYVIDSEAQKKSHKDAKNGDNSDKPVDEQYSEALNELKISWLSKLVRHSKTLFRFECFTMREQSI